MTNGEIIFAAVMFVWLLIDFMGIRKTQKNDGSVNWWGICAMALVPFIPFIAKACGLI